MLSSRVLMGWGWMVAFGTTQLKTNDDDDDDDDDDHEMM